MIRFKKHFKEELKKEIETVTEGRKPNYVSCYHGHRWDEYGDEKQDLCDDHLNFVECTLEGDTDNKLKQILGELEKKEGIINEFWCIGFFQASGEDFWEVSRVYFYHFNDLLNDQELELTLKCEKFIKDSKEEGRPYEFYCFREHVVDALE